MWYGLRMKTETVEIPTSVLSSVETLDELQDWLTAQNPKVIAELRAGKFRIWKSCQVDGEKAGRMIR